MQTGAFEKKRKERNFFENKQPQCKVVDEFL